MVSLIHPEAPTKHLRWRRIGFAAALVGIAVLVVLVLTGCAETQRLMAKEPGAEAFLARAAAAYGVQPPTLIVDGAMPNNWSTRISAEDGRIHIGMKTLDFPEWQLKKVLAHEFSHLLLHNYARGLSPEIENETDAQAVEVLEKADGLSEHDAFKSVYDWHSGQRVLLGELPPAELGAGHGSHCEAIAYLLGRYPEQASWAKRCGEVAAAPPKTPEEIARIRADFEACRVETYPGAKLTEVTPNGNFFWKGAGDQTANEALKACLRGHGRRVN